MRNLYLILILVFFSGCKKDRLKDDKEILVGKWKWVYSVKTIRWNCDDPPQASTLTPATENAEYIIEFKKRGCVSFYKDGEELDKYRIVFSGPFQLSSYSYLSGYYEFQILLNNKEDKFFAGYVSDDTLIDPGTWYPFQGNNESCLSYRNYFVKMN